MAISSLSQSNFARSSIQRLQSQIADTQQQIGSGRHTDVGLTLGRSTSTAISYRAEKSSLVSAQANNEILTGRFDLMDDSLTAVRSEIDSYAKALTNGAATGTGTNSLVTTAKQGLQQVLGGINVSSGGQYLFGGINSDKQPVKSDDASLTAVYSQVNSKFLSALGITDVSQAKSADVEAYFSKDGLTRDVAGVSQNFKYSADFDAVWQTMTVPNSAPSLAKISKSETLETSLESAKPAFKDMVAAYAIIGAVDVEKMGSDARQKLTIAANTKLTGGRDGIINAQADLGVRQSRVIAANEQMKKQEDIVKSAYSRMEDVDIAEAGVLIAQLRTQLDATYAVTAKLQDLSILNYI